MKRLVMAALVVGLAGFITPVQAEEKKAGDPVGTWEWTMGGGNNPRKVTLKITKDGDKMKGVLTTPGRGNNAAPTDTTVDDLKFDKEKGEISFSVSRDRQGTKVTTKYTGTIKEDAIEGKTKAPNQNGDETERDWKATRAKADK